MTAKPRISCAGGRKFFFPRIMNPPVVKYSPVDAVLDTWSEFTHQADMTAFDSHASEVATERLPAWERVEGGIGASGVEGLFLIMTDAAPGRSAWT